MSYRLTKWTRNGDVLATFKAGDEDEARVAWEASPRKRGPAILWHRSEPKPAFPGLIAFAFDELLITHRVAEVRANMPRAKWDRRITAGFTRLMPANVNIADISRPDAAAPLVALGLLRRLGGLGVEGLAGRRVFKAALVQLGVRRWSDFAGIVEADLLHRLGGDRDLLDVFRIRVEAFARMMRARAAREGIPFYYGVASPPVATGQVEARDTVDGEVASDSAALPVPPSTASRKAVFRERPLVVSVRDAMANLGARDASMLSRRLGLDGRPAGIDLLATEFHLAREDVERILARSLALLDELDGWPGHLGDLADELLPISGPEMSGMPWLRGLDPVHLACLVGFGTGADTRIATTSSGHVVGPAGPEDWTAMRTAARRLVLTSESNETPSLLLASIRAGIPAGMGRYERFILRDIGWPTLPGRDWLPIMKGRLTPDTMATVTAHDPAMIGVDVDATGPSLSTPLLVDGRIALDPEDDAFEEDDNEDDCEEQGLGMGR